MLEAVIDTIEAFDLATMQDELTPEQRACWEESIERDMRNMDQPKKYISLEQFGQELMATVRSKLWTRRTAIFHIEDDYVIVDKILPSSLIKYWPRSSRFPLRNP